MTKVLVSSTLTSAASRTVNVKETLDNYTELTAANFYCEVVGLTGAATSSSGTSGGSNLTPTYNASTGVVTIPKLYKYWTRSSGGANEAYVSYKVYAIY